MSNERHPSEGEIIVLGYIVYDWDSGGEAALVYKLIGGKLHPLYGVLDLSQSSYFNVDDHDQFDKALKIILQQKVDRVYTPTGIVRNFYGLKLGWFPLVEQEGNDVPGVQFKSIPVELDNMLTEYEIELVYTSI